MFYSNYLPVNVRRTNCAVYSNEKVFPEDRLVRAYTYISSGNADGIMTTDGFITFIDAPEIKWTIPEIYCAYEAYITAKENNFSFYTVIGDDDVPNLFVSKAFRGHRILVNAFNMRSILLTNKLHVNKAASLIDRKVSSGYCNDFFCTMQAMESGKAKFLPAVLVNRDTPDEYISISPITALQSDISSVYFANVIEDMRKVRENPEAETETCYIKDKNLYRKDSTCYKPLPLDFVDYVIAVYDKLKEKKNNYLEINSDLYETELYFSSNQRYLVNARTFEVVVIKNQHTKQLLSLYAANANTPLSTIRLAWMLAKTE